MPLTPAFLMAAFCIWGDLEWVTGSPVMPTMAQSSPKAESSSALSCPGAVGDPTYPNVNSFPRILCLMRVTVPVSPIPNMTCFLPSSFDAR